MTLQKNTVNEDRIREMSKSIFLHGDNEHKMTSLKKRMDNLKKENELLKAELKALKSMDKVPQGGIGSTELNLENAKLKTDNFELQRNISQLRDQIDKIGMSDIDNVRTKQILDENEKLKLELKILKEGNFEAYGGQLERDSKQQQEQVRALEIKNADMEIELGKTEMECANLKKGMQSRSGTHDRSGLAQENQDLRRQLDIMADQIRQLEDLNKTDPDVFNTYKPNNFQRVDNNNILRDLDSNFAL